MLNTLFYMTVLVHPSFTPPPPRPPGWGGGGVAKFQDNILLFVAAYVGIQAVIEAVLGCVISGSVCKALRVVMKQ